MTGPADLPIKRIDVAEFRERGYLQELNRRFLHPLGMALEVVVDDDGTERLGGVWDYRDDPEGMRYEGYPSGSITSRAAAVDAEWASKTEARVRALGYMVQPPGDGETHGGG